MTMVPRTSGAVDTEDAPGDACHDPSPGRLHLGRVHEALQKLRVICLDRHLRQGSNRTIRNLRAGFVILVLIVAAGCALTDALALPPTPQFLIVRVLLGVLAVGALLWFTFFTSDITEPTATALGPPNLVLPSPGEIADEYAAITRAYEPDTLKLFTNMLGNLPHYLTRINEHIEFLEETSQLRVTRRQSYQIDKEAPNKEKSPVFLVPLALMRKGTLLDSFVVRDASGNSVSTLPYSRCRGLLAFAIQVLLDTAMHYDKGSSTVEGDSAQQPNATLRDLTIAVCGPGPLARLRLSKQHQEHVEKIDAALKSIQGLPILGEWKDSLSHFCEQYVDHYVIVAELPRGESSSTHMELTYSHLVPFDNVGGKHNQWREHFGLRPSVIDIPLHPYAFQVEAYHQEIEAEPDQYVFDHHLERLKTRKSVEQKDLRSGDVVPYVRLYHNEARPNAHLYIRRQRASPAPQSLLTEQSSSAVEDTQSGATKPERAPLGPFKSVIELREIPPGASGAVATIALASATIISFFAITHMGLDINPYAKDPQAEQIRATLNSDIPALLLALPAFVSVLIGSWLDLSRLRRGSLTTYLGLVATMFLSLASALYFVFDVNQVLPTADITTIGGIKIHTDRVWLTLMAVSVTLFLLLFRQVVAERRYYAERIKRRVGKPQGEQQGVNSV
ncbi:MAG: hypothetical protein LC775_10225 [Acidobacteria bacterium]|nr:hypothetical protein [Acidobacteriota bacterium]